MTEPPLLNDETKQRALLRRQFREQRRQLSDIEQRQASIALRKRLLTSNILLGAQTIACYCSDDGEIDLTPTISTLISHKRKIALPFINFSGAMHFKRFTKTSRLTAGRFNILHPDKPALNVAPLAIDLILVPLVAFDSQGHRLGRGGGFYDRYLAQFDRARRYNLSGCAEAVSRPKVVGVAHSLQQHPELPIEPWDIPMDAVVTDTAVCYFRGKANGLDKA